MGGRRKKRRTHVREVEDAGEEGPKIPRTFVFFRGGLETKLVKELVQNTRLMMEPYTARKLKVRKANTLKDFVHVAGPLGVTHLLVFSSTDIGLYLRVMRSPRGPTLTFRINRYSLVRECLAAQRRPPSVGTQFRNPPLVVLNNMAGDSTNMQFLSTTFQNLFPPLNVQTVNLATCRRVVLFTYEKDRDVIEMRHFHIGHVPTGLSRTVKRIVQSRVPKLGGCEDISECLEAGYATSDSEGDDPETHVELDRPRRAKKQIAVRLQEIGPRMTLELIKIEDGLSTGSVLFHKFVKKTREELIELEARREQREQRRKQQEAIVEKKREEMAKKRLEKKEKRQKKKRELETSTDPADESSEDEDAEWFRREVGKDMDEEEGIVPAKKRPREVKSSRQGRKKRRVEE